MQTQRVELSKLVVDYNLYPRTKVESVTVANMNDAVDAGILLPPIIVDSKTFKIADGVHRYNLNKQRGMTDIECILKDYPNEQALFLDAMALNAQHGRQLSPFDKTRCILRAKELKISDKNISVALCLTPERMTELRADKTAEIRGPANGRIALKATVQHMVGSKLTKEQANIMPKIGGMQAGFYVNQIVMLIEHDMINRENEFLMAALVKLQTLLDEFLKVR